MAISKGMRSISSEDILNKVKEFDNFSQIEALTEEYEGLKITDQQIKDPNNPAILRDVKLITYTI